MFRQVWLELGLLGYDLNYFCIACFYPRTRLELRKHGGIEFFLSLLDLLPYWRAAALDAIVSWYFSLWLRTVLYDYI